MVATTEERLAGFNVSDPIKTVHDTVSRIKKDTDMIIVVAHIGKTDPDVNIQKLAEAVPDIDVIIDGHDHIAVPDGKKLNRSVMVNVGQYGDYLGQLTLKLKNKKIISWEERLLDKTSLLTTEPDEKTAGLIQNIRKDSEAVFSKRVMELPFRGSDRIAAITANFSSLHLHA